MVLSGKMEYTQADGALTVAKQAITFSTNLGVVIPNGIVVKNEEASGSTKVVEVCINSDEDIIVTLSAGQRVKYSLKKVKQLKLSRTGTGAPAYRVNGVR